MIEIRHSEEDGYGWVQDVYDGQFNYGTVRQLDSLYYWFFKLLDVQPHTRLLDVACGDSQLVHLATKIGIDAVGLDFSHHALRWAQSWGAGQYTHTDAEKIPFADDQFDYVTSVGSLEHYADMGRGVQEMARVLKRDGTAVIFVPNTFSILHNVYMSFKTGYLLDDGQPLQRYATRSQWQELIEANGFKIVATHKYERERPLFWRDFIWYLRNPKRLVYLLLTPFIPTNLAMCFAFICKVRSDH